MSRVRYTPDRGDIVWLNFAPQTGHEQSGKRPALILSPSSYNQKVGLALCCPITSRIKEYPFEVALPSESKIQGAILSDHVKSLDWKARRATFIERVEDEVHSSVAKKIQLLLKG